MGAGFGPFKFFPNAAGPLAGVTTVSRTGNETLASGANWVLDGAGSGTKLGTAASQKLGFWNATPVIQQSVIAAPAGGVVQDAEARTTIGSLLTLVQTIGITAAS